MCDAICGTADRKSTRLNSSHLVISYAVFCLKKKKKINIIGSREGSRNRERLKVKQTGKKFRVGIKSNISTNRNNLISLVFFFFNDTATTEIYTLSLHDALPIWRPARRTASLVLAAGPDGLRGG